MKKNFSKLLALYLPYLLLGLAATNFGEAWRLAEGKEMGDRILSLMSTIPAAFANPLPSLHPLDILVGICCGAGPRLAVYLKSKNAKKYRHGMEYGSARWGNAKDIEPFQAPKFEDNIILTKTERLMMSNRPPDPKNARNKNVLVVGGSGSGKTRFFIKLTTWVEVQIRYRTVWVISPAGIPVPTQVPYEYKIFHTKLENRGLEVVIREELTEDQWQRYQIFQDTLGGRPYLFNGVLPPGGSDGSGAPGIDYTVPAEALTDSEFASIYEEAKKYVGTPYVWGGSSPETGFDCSGYVCWVYNQNGYDVGRTTANGLWQKSRHISEAEAKPGDLVFFKGTYDTPGMSHCGIYLGNGMMVSAGDPIKYANIHSSYWQQYLAGFGRLSN